MRAERASSNIAEVSRVIQVLRGQRVILDRDLAALYGVTTKQPNEAVRRNSRKFPSDFLFRVTAEEAELSRSQIATLNAGRGKNVKHLPYASAFSRRISLILRMDNLACATVVAPSTWKKHRR